jgi:predicted transcriptional regulator
MVNNQAIHMTDIDDLLSIIENPTRRRILEYLTREPSYPLQLSKELGISQQAVMKNLALMEQSGMLMSHQEESRMGPTRTVYAPNQRFTIIIDLHDNMFTVRMIPTEEGGANTDVEGAEEALDRIREIDSEMEELDARRAELLRERSSVIGKFNEAVRSIEDPEQRKELYERLESNKED